MRRLMAGAGLAVGSLLLMTTTAFAGGWALIQADPGTPPQPNAGQEVQLGFNVLQHGVTPISWVKATLVAVNSATGKQVGVTAVPQGPEGHYVATVTFPESGYWTWHVEITDLIGESVPSVVAVNTADGVAPTMDQATILAAIERARAEMRTEYQDVLGQRTEQFESRISSMNLEIAALKGAAGSLEDSRDKLQARVDELEAPGATGGLPAIAIATIAALAGGLSGFGMIVLGRRHEAAPVSDYVPTTR